MIHKLLVRFSAFDLAIIALTAAVGVAIKPIVVPLAHIITGPLLLPGGVVAGGFYMLWIVLGAGLVGKAGAATLIALVQAIMVVVVGIFGSHGVLSLLTYLAPGLAVDAVFLLSRHRGCCLTCCFFAGIMANISGSFAVNLVFFRLPLIPLLLSLSAAAISGGIGGIIASNLISKIRKTGLKQFGASLVLLVAVVVIGTPTTTAALPIIGDVHNVITLQEGSESIALQGVLEEAAPLAPDFQVVFQAVDGLAALVDGDSLENVSLGFSSDKGWHVIAPDHPRSTGIKHLAEVVVVSQGDKWNYGLNVISLGENKLNLTPGQVLTSLHNVWSMPAGTSRTMHSVTVLERYRGLSVKGLLDGASRGLLFASNGQERFVEDGFVIVYGNQFDYIGVDGRDRISDIKGLILDPPRNRNSDAFHDSLFHLERGQKVLLIILDGFGFHQFKYVKEQGLAPFLGKEDNVRPVLAQYQPVTNAGLASILSGVSPEYNGVYSRRQRELLVPDIFKRASQIGKTAAFVMGSINVLNLTVDPLLNLDRNQNGSTDDEVFAAALRKIQGEEPDLLVVHFKGIDQAGHSFGDLDQRTIYTIVRNDDYVRQLVGNWQGVSIITADHGMHSQDDAGFHGLAVSEDMFVPYIIIGEDLP